MALARIRDRAQDSAIGTADGGAAETVPAELPEVHPMMKRLIPFLSVLIVAAFIYGLYSSNLWAITQTLAGAVAAGKWTGIQNCAGNMAGIAAPVVTGFIVERTGSFYFAFVWVCVNLVISALAYLFIVGRVEPVSWSLSSTKAGAR